MNVKLLGRCLLRRVKMTNGQDALMVCGVFLPLSIPNEKFVPNGVTIDLFDPKDEMWVTEIELAADKSIKFVNADNLQFSPEDFLANEDGIQDNKKWTRKY